MPFAALSFEWDSDKADANLAKHGITFEAACEAFFDPFLHVVDAEDVDNELRESLIGATRQLASALPSSSRSE